MSHQADEEGTDMPMSESENPQGRQLAAYEAGFWAFLEYPAFWVPVVVLTFLGAVR
jgi:hypothetical protein